MTKKHDLLQGIPYTMQGNPMDTNPSSSNRDFIQNNRQFLDVLYRTLPSSHTTDETTKLLYESEARYRSLIAATAQIVWTTSVDGLVIGELASWCAYTGQSPEEVRGTHIIDAVHPDDRIHVRTLWLEAVKGRRPYEAIYRLKGADGIYRTFLARGVPVFANDGTIREWVGTCTDITQWKLMEEQLYESERRFRLTFEQVAVGIAHVAPDGHWLLVNQRLCEILGYTREELLQMTFQEITYPPDLDADVAFMQDVLAGRLTEYSMEKRYIRHDGSLLWANLKVTLVRNDDGQPAYFISVVEDISQRKQDEDRYQQVLRSQQQSQQEAEERAKQIEATFEALTDVVMVYNNIGNLTYANKPAQQLFALNMGVMNHAPTNYGNIPLRERLQPYNMRSEDGKPLPYEQWPHVRIINGAVIDGTQAVDVIMWNPTTQHDLQFSITGAPIRNVQGAITGAILISRDVTERRRLERRTHEALNGLLEMAEAIIKLPDQEEQTDDIYILGAHLAELTRSVLDCQRVGIQLVEPETERVYPVAVVGLSPELEQQWWAEQRQQQASLKDNPMPDLVERLRANEVFALDLREAPFNAAPNPYNVQVMLTAPLCVEKQLVGILTLDYNGETHLYTERELALASAVGKLSAFVFERQRLLRERAEAQGREIALREAKNHMEDFLGIASHELRTPMTTIKANIQLAQRRATAGMRQTDSTEHKLYDTFKMTYDLLTRAEQQVDVLNRLVSDLIDISRIQQDKLQLHIRPEPCNLSEIIQECVHEQCKTIRNRTIELTMPKHDLFIQADPDRIAQVVANYLSNALKYSPAHTSVRVILDSKLDDENGQPVAFLQVQDKGQGIPQEEQPHIWERFYQARGVTVQSGSGVGLGLGLHISQTIIARHGGKVGVYSRDNDGSTFWFTLPLLQ